MRRSIAARRCVGKQVGERCDRNFGAGVRTVTFRARGRDDSKAMMQESLPIPMVTESLGLHTALRSITRLSGRLQSLGIPVAELETSAGLPALWLDKGERHRPAAVISTDLDSLEFSTAIAVVTRLASGRPLSILPYGAPLAHPERLELRDGDAAFPIYEPFDPSALRFQVNRATRPLEAIDRGALRAPIEREVCLKIGLRREVARVYTLSSTGAFLLLERPLRRGRRVDLEVPLGGANKPRASGRVAFTNRADAPKHIALPTGVALHFDRIDAIAACAIDHLVQRRLKELRIA